MTGLESVYAQCPYCGERIELLVDTSIAEQAYVEDCAVCCRPINVLLRIDEDARINLELRDENSC